jgi:membrane fusion protein, multidrug efflux system
VKTVDSASSTPAQRAGKFETHPAAGSPPAAPKGGGRVLLAAFLVAALAGAGWFWAKKHAAATTAGGAAPGGRPAMGSFPVSVIPGVVEQKDVPIYLDGLGTVQAFNMVTVRSRVDGQVVKIAFTEGQEVKAGDLLAQIDPAPFQAQLDQNTARKAQDEAQLAIARITLARDKELLDSKILSQQEYDVQKAQVDQLVATVQADQATIDNAKVQLAYATITAPLAGRVGIRQIDQGNLVKANDTIGLVVITQLRPISIVFTLPEQTLPQIQAHLQAGEALSVLALDRDNRTTLGTGKLAVIDNQIDTMTGTIRLKATFPNEDSKLWPGQFVNVRLWLETRKNGLTVPASVVQRGPEGPFAYVLAQEGTNLVAKVRPIKVAQIEQNQALIDEGLTPGEPVVVDGQNKLQAGSKVRLPEKKKAEGKMMNAEDGGAKKPESRNPKAEGSPKGEGRGSKANAAAL